MYGSRIVGTGSYAPARVLTNADLERLVDTSDGWIVTRTGISERRIAADGEATSDLAEPAGRRALEMAGVDPMDVDLLLVGTITPDMWTPSTACVLQDRLGTRRAAAFDLSAGCTGFIYCLAVVDSMLRTGAYRTALVIGAETLSRVLDWRDRNTCVLFGDGAGAVVVQRTDGGDRGILSAHLYSDGTQWDQLAIPGGGSRAPLGPQVWEERLNTIRMPNGNEVFKVAVRSMEEAAITALKHHRLDVKDIDRCIPHQANYRIIQAVAQRLGLPEDRLVVNIGRYGNTSAASIPLALDEAVRDGRILPGHLLLFCAFGAGLTWGSAVVRW